MRKSSICLSAVAFGIALGVSVTSPETAQAATVTSSTGDLGNNVIDNAGEFEVFLNAVSPSNALPASIDIKYGLWNSPSVVVSTFFNSTLLGTFTADQGYITPGPEFINFDVSGLLVDGANSIRFTGFNANAGDYVIGQVDLSYETASSIPIPTPALLPGLIGMGIAAFRNRQQETEAET